MVKEIECARQHKEAFLEANKKCKEIIDVDDTLLAKELEEFNDLDDEVWIMRCPQGIDITAMEGRQIKLPGRTNLEQFEASAMEFPEIHSQMCGYHHNDTYKLCNIGLQGVILLRKRFSNPTALNDDEIDSASIQIGLSRKLKGIKKRHPLFGKNFEERVEVRKEISERLEKADEISMEMFRKARTTLKKKSSTTRKRNLVGNISSHFVSPSVVKIKKEKSPNLSSISIKQEVINN